MEPCLLAAYHSHSFATSTTIFRLEAERFPKFHYPYPSRTYSFVTGRKQITWQTGVYTQYFLRLLVYHAFTWKSFRKYWNAVTYSSFHQSIQPASCSSKFRFTKPKLGFLSITKQLWCERQLTLFLAFALHHDLGINEYESPFKHHNFMIKSQSKVNLQSSVYRVPVPKLTCK